MFGKMFYDNVTSFVNWQDVSLCRLRDPVLSVETNCNGGDDTHDDDDDDDDDEEEEEDDMVMSRYGETCCTSFHLAEDVWPR